ncbi:myosin heavy chain, clone, putative [Pediculus humanus corporis]|uniref:Myosin heavy chain, clone, putative n=1 Tax=Pediculus humanus subsp. corporis TaxID=121224 RepID=E0VYF2_PEDHC|nr:myosin heavy chain, clone, putative [Pediculus humanus corporis]EEB18408.1 myosin heavy chain, clone, putative [Pediculus humanus corporis]
MNEPFQLVTNSTFKGKDYLIKMCILNSKKLELIVTDKLMGEDWHCEYDSSYIEALTHKTGNYKQFDVFIIMLKSGLLKTSECISLDLLTIEDLEELRNKKIINSYTTTSSSRTNHNLNLNKRYLILTYSVEFDRIHYPLPLDYCGPPNPSILQNNIRRLEGEIERLKQININLCKSDENETKKLYEKIKILTDENVYLTNENHRLNKLLNRKECPRKTTMQTLHNSLKKLEEKVIYERNNNYKSLIKLRGENRRLMQQAKDYKNREKNLKVKLRDATRQNIYRGCKRNYKNYLTPDNSPDRKKSSERSETMYQPFHKGKTSPTTDVKCKKIETFRKVRNRFLSSSSSESGSTRFSRVRQRETTTLSPGGPGKTTINSKINIKSKNGSMSRNSSEDGSCRKKQQSENSSSKNTLKRCGNVREGENSQKKNRSRDSSLSSRCSSKHSKLSNRGSGDHHHQHNDNKKTKSSCKKIDTSKEDLKLSVSDIETRIHALQKILDEGLNF